MNLTLPSAKFTARLRRALALSSLISAVGLTAAHADSPTDTLTLPNTSLVKASNWSTGAVPAANVTAVIAEGASSNPLGYNNNSGMTLSGTSPNKIGTITFGDLDFVSGATNLVVGVYNTSGTETVTTDTVTLGGSTLNSVANTVIANSSGKTITFENDVAPSGDNLTESAHLTYALTNSSNTIQATAGSNIIIDTQIMGSGALTYLGGGSGSATGATLELGAGSANDVTGGVAANAPTPANGGSFTSSATVQSSDANTFSGGLTVGDTAGTANAGVVKVDGANALPTTGAVTVNTNSQLLLNGNGTYGGTGQTVTLNGSGTGGSNNGALATASGNVSTLQTSVSLASNTAINVAGSAGQLTLSGAVGGAGKLTTVGTGTLVLSGSNNYTGGTAVASGVVVASNAHALGTAAVTVSGGTLKTTVSTVDFGAGLTLSSGSIALNSATFSLASGSNFSMTGGTLDLTAGTPGAIDGSGAGTFSLGGGTLDLGGATGWNYSDTYDILAGFASGSVSGISITDYDSTDYVASVSTSGILSFAAVPEPASWGLGLGAAGLFLALRRLRRETGRP